MKRKCSDFQEIKKYFMSKIEPKISKLKTIIYFDIYFPIKYELWYDIYNIYLLHFFRHYIKQERCETCRNWEYEGILRGRKYGNCKVLNEWDDYHAHCYNYNVDMSYEERGVTDFRDGCEKVSVTPTGKVITVVSRRGRWMYLHDGRSNWEVNNWWDY